MKSYKNHLITTKSFGETKDISYNPTMRSSAIFPLIHTTKKISSIYTFMGYWLKKRNIAIISVLVTIRDANGKKIKKESIEVNSIKSYSIYSSDLLGEKNNKFFGSIEFEIFSAVDMVFPYPAITFGLKSVNGLTFVHTCGRIYNNFDDIKSNEEYVVPETGFDVFISKKYKPFFIFVNGPIKIKNKKIRLEFIDTKGRKKISDKIIEKVNPYGLGWVNLLEDKERKFFKNEEKICVKVYHKFNGFFPRLVAGNVLKNFQGMSLTHSYYDTSKKVSKSSYSHNRSIRNFYDSVTSIPFDSEFSEIELAIYPNMPIAPTNLKLELYTNEGSLVDVIEYENKKYYKTGDLGRIKYNFLYYIGRKSNNYKLSNGKFVSVDYYERKIKSVLKNTQLMLYGDNKQFNIMIMEECNQYNKEFEKKILLQEINRELPKFAYVKDILFLKKDTFSKFLTPKMSLKKKELINYYQEEINHFYESI